MFKAGQQSNGERFAGQTARQVRGGHFQAAVQPEVDDSARFARKPVETGQR